jgi:hypothetical protein
MMKPLLPQERLDLLRLTDTQRKWYSLDDKRICAVCDRVFRGRQIEFERDHRGHYSLHCPTPGCPAELRHWFLCEISPASYSQPLPKTGEATFFYPSDFGHA